MTKLDTYVDASPTENHICGPVPWDLVLYRPSWLLLMYIDVCVCVCSLKVSFGMQVHLKLLETAQSKAERAVSS